MLRVVGLMSGTSLDGLDLALCSIELAVGGGSYEMHAASTIRYSEHWKSRLTSAMTLNAREFAQLDADFGTWVGQQVRQFLNDRGETADLVSSHGHTVFHEPAKKVTVQIGKGSHIAAECGLPVVCDFRNTDVALGGQGAPLVPIGDRILFSQYDFCLNLGGFANISYELHGQRLAFDICPVNIALNLLASQIGLEYDHNGEIAATGKINDGLLSQLNELGFYQQEPPKSLGKEWFDVHVLPLLRESGLSFRDMLATFTEHASLQIGSAVKGWTGTMLVTGGGAWNNFLIERLRNHCDLELIIPDEHIVNYKEAVIFGLLGVMYEYGIPNPLHNVTGASRPSIAGCRYFGKP
jgi:anhydro-N-acetylmuramic acid kinase